MAGISAGIDLPRGTVLRHNTLLIGDDENKLLIRAAPESVVEARALDAVTLTRLAYHLGNRHVPMQVVENALRFQPDHVLSDMVVGLGGTVTASCGPFDPEAGAYAGGHSHAHHHDTEGGATPRDVKHAPLIHDLSDQSQQP